jgi:hypothetical protein
MGGGNATSSINEIWESPNGINWSSVKLPANSPFTETTKFNQQCTTMNGRVYFIGEDSTVSSTDLVHWQDEPRSASVFAAPGAVSINNRIYITSGAGTSQREVQYTTP